MTDDDFTSGLNLNDLYTGEESEKQPADGLVDLTTFT